MQALVCSNFVFNHVYRRISFQKKNNTAHHQHMNAHKDISLHLSQLTAKK